jgi:pilus assembly protein CpaB
MGKFGRRTVVLAALCAGLLAALLAYLFLNQERAQAARMTQPVQVVVAAQDIPARTVIEPGMVREATRPVGTLPTNTATSVSEVMGQVTLAALKSGRPIERAAVAFPSGSLGLAYVVPEGMRAVAVALDPIIGVAGFLKAGDHVDVLATFEVDKLGVTKTVLQDVELLAIGPEIVPAETDKPGTRDARPKEQPNAILALTPDNAEKLILAESQGKLRLTLRSKGDAGKVYLAGARSDTLIGVRPATTVAAASPAPRPSAKVMSVGYTSPAFLGGYSSSGPMSSAAGPQPVTFAGRAKISADDLASAVTVETVRGTQKTTVDVRAQ